MKRCCVAFAGVHAVNGQLVLDVHPRGSMIIMR